VPRSRFSAFSDEWKLVYVTPINQSPSRTMAKHPTPPSRRGRLRRKFRRRRLSVVDDGDDISTKATPDVAATSVHRDLAGPKTLHVSTPSSRCGPRTFALRAQIPLRQQLQSLREEVLGGSSNCATEGTSGGDRPGGYPGAAPPRWMGELMTRESMCFTFLISHEKSADC